MKSSTPADDVEQLHLPRVAPARQRRQLACRCERLAFKIRRDSNALGPRRRERRVHQGRQFARRPPRGGGRRFDRRVLGHRRQSFPGPGHGRTHHGNCQGRHKSSNRSPEPGCNMCGPRRKLELQPDRIADEAGGVAVASTKPVSKRRRAVELSDHPGFAEREGAQPYGSLPADGALPKTRASALAEQTYIGSHGARGVGR